MLNILTKIIFGMILSVWIFFIPLYRKSYPNKQSDADHGNWDGCQLITQKQSNSSNSLDSKEVYSLYRFWEKLCHYTNISLKNRTGCRNEQHYSRHTNTIVALLHWEEADINPTVHDANWLWQWVLSESQKRKKNLSRTSRENVPTFLKNLYKFLENLYKFSAGLAESIFSSRRMLMQTSAEKQHDVEYGNNDGNGVKHKRTPPRVGILPHDAPWRGERQLQKDGERQLDAQYHLRNNQSLKRIVYE